LYRHRFYFSQYLQLTLLAPVLLLAAIKDNVFKGRASATKHFLDQIAQCRVFFPFPHILILQSFFALSLLLVMK